jgi:CIC family chloride channel protein
MAEIEPPSEPERPDDPTSREGRPRHSSAAHDPWGATGATPLVEQDLQATGYFKALPTSGRLARLWATLGLLLGRRLALVVRDDHVFLILMAAVVGMTSGAAAGLLLMWIEFAIESFPKPEEGDVALRWIVVLAVPVIGGLLAGWLRVLAARFVRQPPQNGITSVIEAIALRGGVMRGRSAAVCGLGTGITIGSGGSCGHEGPSVAIGAAVGSVVARFFGLRQRRQLAMLGAGASGGLAAAFNTPLAGVIFTVEIVFGGSIGGDVGTMSVFIPLIVAAVCGTFTSYAIRGEDLAFDLPLHGTASVPDLAFYVVLALLAGLIGTAMSRLIVLTESRFESLRAPVWIKPAIGALAVGLLAALVSNELLGAGHSTVQRALQGGLTWQLAAALLVLKIVATALTIGSGGYGGTFLPSLYVGACLGTLVGVVANLALSDAQDPGAYALVGMGAIFAAMMHAPLTPIVIMFELTHDYGVILPLMLGCILSGLVARRFGRSSLIKLQLERRGVVMKHEAEGEVMKRGQVRDLVLGPTETLPLTATLEEIRRAALDAELRAVFVVDPDGMVVGYINGNQLAKRMLAGEIKPESTAKDLMGRSKLPLLHLNDTLAGAMLASARSGMELLPVVDEACRLIGVLRRGDLLAHYSDKVLAEREEVVAVRAGTGRVGEEVGLGKGLVLERIIVGRAWAGRSLGELELRKSTGAAVLEWARGEVTMPVDPKAPLREGDVLAIAGTREQILRARSLR